MEGPPEQPGREQQAEFWEKFYQDHKRPWRGISKISVDIKPGSKVLDVGCGTGKTTAALIKMGMDVTGLDFSVSAISHCIGMYGEKAKFTLAECDRMPFPEDSFDAIVAVHIFEHLDKEQIAGTVKEISRVLIPGGIVFVRCFAVGDARSHGKTADTRGNGIAYRYYSEEEMIKIFDGFEPLFIERKDESMKFGVVRVKMECLFRLPP